MLRDMGLRGVDLERYLISMYALWLDLKTTDDNTAQHPKWPICLGAVLIFQPNPTLPSYVDKPGVENQFSYWTC